jgi:NAD(P)-dependent dehydrogenase (short-subunit alcohol dehydrogenase family)
MNAKSSSSLEGRVALITGASRSNGIGHASALRLGMAGARVIITDLEDDATQTSLSQRRNELEAEGVEAIALPMNVTRPARVGACIRTIESRYSRLDIIVNNAGCARGTGPFEHIAPETWYETLDINLMGIVHTTRAALPLMRHQGSGAIVNIASVAGLGAVPLMAAYTASKFAVVGLTKALASEFAPEGIRVNAICPGMVWTDMGRFETELLGRAEDTPEQRKRMLSREVPLGQRWAEPDEVAGVVVFLAGADARYITGVALPVAGGLPAGL